MGALKNRDVEDEASLLSDQTPLVERRSTWLNWLRSCHVPLSNLVALLSSAFVDSVMHVICHYGTFLIHIFNAQVVVVVWILTGHFVPSLTAICSLVDFARHFSLLFLR